MRLPSFRTIGLLLVLTLAAISISGCAMLRGTTFYWNLFRANRAGARFYRSYEHLDRDVAYTDLSDVRLDVYSPPEGDDHPVLIFVHGGGWDSYDKELFAPVAMQLLPRDMVVVIPDYTLHPDATYEQMAGEIAASVAWTLENAAHYRGNPNRVVLSGHSAGGHLSGLVAFDPRWLATEGRSPRELCGWIGLSGVYDVNLQMAFERSNGGTAPVMTAVMQGEENFATASPASYPTRSRNAHVERAWLIHGIDDQTVPVAMSESFASLLTRAGVETELMLYPDRGHSDFLFDALSDQSAPVLQDIDRAVSASCLDSVE
ncbi:MAG TPA: alpha/beta hydrolase [Spirochaetia bacterium]|nr:alpha/beta hydrolase [Spirochaetia bacterium]